MKGKDTKLASILHATFFTAISISGLARAADPALPATQSETRATTQPAKTLTLDLGSKVTMKLVLIPAGRFMMGSPVEEKGRKENEGPQRDVAISRPFYMGIYEVTQDQYEPIMGANPSRFKGAAKPVERVSWDDAVAFCNRASAKTGRTFRLPTEAEWEYTCRSGNKTRFCFGDDDEGLGAYAWYGGNSRDVTHPVGQKKPNAFGVYDMHGNVWEWCSDWYAESCSDAPDKDPGGPKSGEHRVCRGGSWYGLWDYCRSATRGKYAPDTRIFSVGFRVVVPVSPTD